MARFDRSVWLKRASSAHGSDSTSSPALPHRSPGYDPRPIRIDGSWFEHTQAGLGFLSDATHAAAFWAGVLVPAFACKKASSSSAWRICEQNERSLTQAAWIILLVLTG